MCRCYLLYHCSHSLSLIAILCHSLSLVVTLCHPLYHSLSLAVPLAVTRCTTRCHSLSFDVARCHSFYHSLSLVVALCHPLYHSLSLVVPLAVTRCPSLSLVVTRCTTRLSFYKRSLVPASFSYFLELFSSCERKISFNLKETQFIKNTTFGLWEKMKVQPKKRFVKYQWTQVPLSSLNYFANFST